MINRKEDYALRISVNIWTEHRVVHPGPSFSRKATIGGTAVAQGERPSRKPGRKKTVSDGRREALIVIQ